MLNKLIERLYFKQKNNLALYDCLTRTYNKNYLEYIAASKYDKCQVFITMIDIDGFESINDTYGHVFGDQIIKNTAELLNRSFKNEKVIRYGGDEFVLLTTYSPENKLKEINDVGIRFPISYGIKFKNKCDKFYDCLCEADMKMYEMKTK